MAEIRDTSCCGVAEIVHIGETSSVELILDAVGEDRYEDDGQNGAFYFFTDIGRARRGHDLAKYIRDHKLGKVSRSEAKRNPNTGNRVIIFTWALQGNSFKAWYRKRHPKEPNNYY